MLKHWGLSSSDATQSGVKLQNNICIVALLPERGPFRLVQRWDELHVRSSTVAIGDSWNRFQEWNSRELEAVFFPDSRNQCRTIVFERRRKAIAWNIIIFCPLFCQLNQFVFALHLDINQTAKWINHSSILHFFCSSLYLSTSLYIKNLRGPGYHNILIICRRWLIEEFEVTLNFTQWRYLMNLEYYFMLSAENILLFFLIFQPKSSKTFTLNRLVWTSLNKIHGLKQSFVQNLVCVALKYF